MNKKDPPASLGDDGKFLMENAVPIPESYEMRKYSFLEVMKRIRAGKTDDQDAEQVERWVIGDPRGQTVRAYLRLVCHSSDAKKFIARDLREGLAAELLREGAGDERPSGEEKDLVDRWVKDEHRTMIFTALSILETYMTDVVQFVARDIRVKLADRLVRPDR